MGNKENNQREEQPLDVLLLSEKALEDALLAEDVTFRAAKGINEGLEAEATSIEGLDGVLAEALLLRAIPELPLFIVREESEIIVILRVPLRHPSTPEP